MSATAHDTPTLDTPMKRSHADTLRVIADWLDQHPDFPVDQILTYGGDIEVMTFANTADDVREIVRAVGGKWDKTPLGDTIIHFNQQIAAGVVAQISIGRGQVCELVTVGTETRTVIEPDPELVAA